MSKTRVNRKVKRSNRKQQRRELMKSWTWIVMNPINPIHPINYTKYTQP